MSKPSDGSPVEWQREHPRGAPLPKHTWGEPAPAAPAHEPPPAASTTGTWNGLEYRAEAQWLVLRAEQKAAADVSTVSHVAQGRGGRPVTFVFGGGPGGSSAYLHLGVVGPRRIAFPGDGTMPPSPPRLVDDPESWPAFTDLDASTSTAGTCSTPWDSGRRALTEAIAGFVGDAVA